MDEFAEVEALLAKLRDRLDLAGLEDPDVRDMLATVRTVAHATLHAAGPMAAFAAGYAAARAGGSAAATAKALADIRATVAPTDA